MKLSYKQKLFSYFFLVFVLFAGVIVYFQQNRERAYKTDTLRATLDNYAALTARYLQESHAAPADLRADSLAGLLRLLPPNLRLSVIRRDGTVLYDNSIVTEEEVESHLLRPEIQMALIRHNGASVRYSHTLKHTYYYYAKAYPHYFVRVALPYDIQVQNFLKADNVFLYFVTLVFFIALFLIIYISDRFGKAISGLRDFLLSAENHRVDYHRIRFPNTELGVIGNQIIRNYRMLEESNRQIHIERDKLLRHFHYSDEGIAIFQPDRTSIYANTHFIQYVNALMDEPDFSLDHLWNIPELQPLIDFLNRNTPVNPNSTNIPVCQIKVEKGGQHYGVKLLVFTDNSFEITLNNISEGEKSRILKQEMTNNIAHELRTPVSSIRGYVETLLLQPDIAPDKQRFFLERTYAAVLRLSDLIRDVALITKTEEAAELFTREPVNLYDTVQEVRTELQERIRRQCVSVHNHLTPTLSIEGNKTLLYAIFRNLLENSLRYAGEGVEVVIDNYMEDEEYCYLTYYDTGQGVPERHLARLFERFYQVNEGRSRQSGGSGLGLSIVKNAVRFHQGDISAKNRKDGGLEFSFSLKKESR